jgi:hypothetical protein
MRDFSRPPIPASTEAERRESFLRYHVNLELTQEDYDGSILVVGSGGSNFAYEAEKLKIVPRGRIVNFELHPDGYIHAGGQFVGTNKEKIYPSIIQGDIRDASFIPDNSYDTVVSCQAPPSIYIGNLMEPKTPSIDKEDIYVYDENPEIQMPTEESIYKALYHEIRIARKRVKIWPVYRGQHLAAPIKKYNDMLGAAITRLKENFDFTFDFIAEQSLVSNGYQYALSCICLTKTQKKRKRNRGHKKS